MKNQSQSPPDAFRPGEPRTSEIAPLGGKSTKTPPPTEGSRDIIETVVFVVVLVVLLKMFLAEAFVIPTGSMATTLLGYHKDVICDKCHYPFIINAHSETGEDQPAEQVIEWTCPNCRYVNHLPSAEARKE
jgi:hypothetical protein